MSGNSATPFDRPTLLEDGERGLDIWFRKFGARLMDALDSSQRPEFLRLVSEYAAPHLLRDGQWYADYRRLRIAGRKLLPTEPPAGA